jgi:dihydrofolate synthase/folylpolyglutamate synthase
MTYAETIQFLYDLGFFGARFGLETTRTLATRVGNPQNKLRFIHVAGTNGKGSTCAMLESIYRAAGLRVGLFTSPHLVSFRERIQVNRQLISEVDVVRLVDELRAVCDDVQPTLFEFVTVMALKFFAEQKCDLVIWETGLGGRLDATNIVTPLASVITNIALDHQQWLGDTLGKIAAEKAGIVKPGVPVITAADAPEALAVIERIARENNSPLTRVHASRITQDSSLPGEHQKLNAALALATVEALQNKIPVSDEAIRIGLENVRWSGRLQLITRPSDQKILLDGAHNVASTQTLVAALKLFFPSNKPALVLGILQDKDWLSICEILSPLAARILLVPVQSERTALPHELAEICRAANPALRVTEHTSLSDALRSAESDRFVVVTGSLYLVGEALALLDPGLKSDGERGLNEWSATVSEDKQQ